MTRRLQNIRWWIARHILDQGTRFCWTDLVMWCLHPSEYRLRDLGSEVHCQSGGTGFVTGLGCYCGKYPDPTPHRWDMDAQEWVPEESEVEVVIGDVIAPPATWISYLNENDTVGVPVSGPIEP